MSQYGYTSLDTSKPVARKKHLCSWCGQYILPGDRYFLRKGVYYGDFQTTKFHPECDDACAKESREYGYDYEFVPYDNERPKPATIG